MVYVDTNVILRYLLNDDEKLNLKACEVFDSNEVFITNEVIVEVCYVLNSVYKISKDIIFTLIMELLSMDNIHFNNRSIIYDTFKIYSKENLDIVDCMLVAYYNCEGRKIATFDKKVEKMLT